MPPPTAADVSQALSAINPDGDGHSAAQRALKSWAAAHPDIGESEEAIRLYMALKSLATRVTPNMMKSMRTTAVSNVLLKSKVWVVLKNLMPEVKADHKDFLVDPSCLQAMPPGCQAATCWFFDQGLSRSALPKGTLEFEVSVGHSSSSAPVGMDARAVEGGESGENQNQQQAITAAAEPSSAPTEQPVSGEAPKSRQLREVKSDDDEAELICSSCKIAFEKGNVYHQDPNFPSVHYWVKTFVRYMKSMTQKDVCAEKLGGFRVFPKYVCTMLLDCQLDMVQLQCFAEAFKELRQTCEALFPQKGLADALVSMADYNPEGQDVLDIDFLPVASRARLVRSVLYETFMSEVFLAKMDVLRKKHDLGLEERLVRIDGLLQLQPDNVELQCVKTVLNKTLNLSGKLKFMAENVAERIPWMQAWCPKHEVLLFQVFLSPNVVLKDIDMETVLECIRLLHVSEADDAIGSFPNGVLKAVAKDSVALWKLAACDAKSLRLAQGFLDELISHKTGIAKRAATNPPAEVLTQEEFSTLSTELTKLVVKLAHPKVDRLVNPWHAYADFLASQIPPKAPVEQPEKVDKTEKPVPPPKEPEFEFQVGDLVKTVAHKRKEQYHDQKATIVQVRSKKIKVELPSAEQKDYLPENLIFLSRKSGETPATNTTSAEAAAKGPAPEENASKLDKILGGADLLD